MDFKNILCIYFWLCWVFIAVQALFQLQGAGALSSWGVHAAHCGGFLLQSMALGPWASVVKAHGLDSRGPWALEHRLNSSGAGAYVGFPGGSVVKNLPAVQDLWVWSLGWGDPLGKEMAIHSSILAWRIPWTEEPSGLQSMGSQRIRHDWATKQQQHGLNCSVACGIFLDRASDLCLLL